jgi:hypothetical protein
MWRSGLLLVFFALVSGRENSVLKEKKKKPILYPGDTK